MSDAVHAKRTRREQVLDMSSACPICASPVPGSEKEMTEHVDICLEMVRRVNDSDVRPSSTCNTRISAITEYAELQVYTSAMNGSSGAAPATKNTVAKHSCPFYKWIPDTKFTVDAFSYGEIPECAAYFLTHFHADHYMGLTSRFSHRPIYCSPATARLVQANLRVKADVVIPLNFDAVHIIDGVEITLIDANHCPGAAVIIFKVPGQGDGRSATVHVHTGDFRAIPKIACRLRPSSIDTLFLDTTYLNPAYDFPPQYLILDAVRALVLELKAKASIVSPSRQSNLMSWIRKSPMGASQSLESTRKTLFVVGTYTIGKERIVETIASALDCKIFARTSRRKILSSIDMPSIWNRVTEDAKAPVHIVPIGELNAKDLSSYLKRHEQYGFNKLAAFHPTGWTWKPTTTAVSSAGLISHAQVAKNIVIHKVPYSEHSSFKELESFVMSLTIRRVVPTVNVGSAPKREQMQRFLDQWNQRKAQDGVRELDPSHHYWL